MAKDLHRVPHDGHAVMAHVVQAPDKRADVGRAGPSGEESLGGREDKRHVGGDSAALLAKPMERLETIDRHRDLDDDVRGPGRDLVGLGEHRLVGGREDLSAHRSRDARAKAANGVPKIDRPRGSEQCGVGGHP